MLWTRQWLLKDASIGLPSLSGSRPNDYITAAGMPTAIHISNEARKPQRTLLFAQADIHRVPYPEHKAATNHQQSSLVRAINFSTLGNSRLAVSHESSQQACPCPSERCGPGLA